MSIGESSLGNDCFGTGRASILNYMYVSVKDACLDVEIVLFSIENAFGHGAQGSSASCDRFTCNLMNHVPIHYLLLLGAS